MHQLKILFLCLFLILGSKISAQNIFVVEGDTLQLQREVKGPMNLFWSAEKGDYRYFVQKGKKLLELRDSTVGGEPQYKQQLEKLTNDAEIYAADVKFELYSLKHFVNKYNAEVQEDYAYNASSSNIKKRIGIFTGFTNNKYTDNPENILAPVVGLELEFYDPNLATRHSVFVHLRHSFEQDEFQYSSTQLSFNYRFKIWNASNFNIHVDAELATLYYSRNPVMISDDMGNIIRVDENEGLSFTAPLSFGLGTDIKLTEEGYLTFGYHDIFSIVLDGNGSFPIDFSIGYKFNF